MSFSLVDLRIRMRVAGRNTASGYTNAIIDEALDRLIARFLRVTRCVKTVSTITMTASTNSADFSALAGFMADRIETLRVDKDSNYTDVRDDLDNPPVGEVLDHLNCDSSTGTPTKIGFTSSTAAKFYPTPKANGTLTCIWCPLQTPWVLGTMGVYSGSVAYVIGDIVSSGGNLYSAILTSTGVAVSTTATWQNLGAGTLVAPANVVSALPDGLMTELIGTGGPAIMQSVDPKQALFAGAQWKNYLDFEAQCRGIGSISGKGFTRESGSRWG